jgi:hypothetical protein
MSKLGMSLLAGIAALLIATSAAHARPRVMICEGQWSDMRTIGLMIGGCDINFIPAKKLKQIKDVYQQSRECGCRLPRRS